MPDPYEGVSTPGPERQRLARSAFRWSALDEVAEAISTATEQFHDLYVERRGDLWRWSLATKGGPYPLLRIAAKYLQVDYLSIIVGFRKIGDGWCVQLADRDDEADAWAVLRFDEFATVQRVRDRIEGMLLQSY